MFEPIVLATFTDVFWAVLVAMFIFMPLVMIWTFALVDLFRRHDIGLAKVVWLIVIVVIPVVGSIIYMLVRPREADLPAANGSTTTD